MCLRYTKIGTIQSDRNCLRGKVGVKILCYLISSKFCSLQFTPGWGATPSPVKDTVDTVYSPIFFRVIVEIICRLNGRHLEPGGFVHELRNYCVVSERREL